MLSNHVSLAPSLIPFKGGWRIHSSNTSRRQLRPLHNMASSQRRLRHMGSDAGLRKSPLAIDDAYLEGPPPTAWQDFKDSKLRQFPRRGRQIKWLRFLGNGIQGAAFKVSIGGGEPVVLKIVSFSRCSACIQSKYLSIDPSTMKVLGCSAPDLGTPSS